MTFEEDQFGRSIYKATLEVQYGIQLNQLNEDFYTRVDRLLTLVSLLAVAGVVINLFESFGPTSKAILGIAVVACAAIQAIWQPATAAAVHREAKRAFYALNRQVRELNIAEAFARIDAIRADLPAGVDALAQPAFNRAMQANGQDLVALHWSERLAQAFAR